MKPTHTRTSTTKRASNVVPRDYIEIGNQYARDVAAGKIPNCKWVILACKRHLDDLARQTDSKFAYRFDDKAAIRVCKFVELKPHTKGEWAARRERLVMQPWQVFMTICIFGWLNKDDGFRRFRRAMLLVPRKNGKSAWAAAIGLYMLAADGEHGAEVYSGATSEKQAWEVFRPARLMAQRDGAFTGHYGIEVNASNLHILSNGSRFEPLIGKPGDGASPSCAIIDEYHEHDTDDLLATMQTGMGARGQPLILVITTAGASVGGPCYQMMQMAQRMLEGVIEDNELFALMYGVDVEDDWTDPASLVKANPNYGVSTGEKHLLSQQVQAINDASKVYDFQTKHLNRWVTAKAAFFNVQRFIESTVDGLSIDDFANQPVRLGLDLASKVDIAAIELVFRLDRCNCERASALAAKGYKYARFGRYYLPSAAVDRPEAENYHTWRDSFIIADGEMNDQTQIRDDILALAKQFQVEEIAYDPSNARMMISELEAEGLSCTEVLPSQKNFSDPMKTMDGLIRERAIAHDGDEVFTWMLSNVVTKEINDKVYPRKERVENKIDGVVAHIMALGRWMLLDDVVATSPWNDPNFSLSNVGAY